MRAITVNEAMEFKRGQGIKKSLGVGKEYVSKQVEDFKEKEEYDEFKYEILDNLKVKIKSFYHYKNFATIINSLGEYYPDIEFYLNDELDNPNFQNIDWDIINRSIDVESLKPDQKLLFFSKKLYNLLVIEKLDYQDEEIQKLIDDAGGIENLKQYRPLFDLFKKDLNIILNFFKEYQDEDEKEYENTLAEYVFVGKDAYKEIDWHGKKVHDKFLEIENLYQIDKYNEGDLLTVQMMKLRAPLNNGRVYTVWIPKWMHDEKTAYDSEISDELREYIDKNKQPA